MSSIQEIDQSMEKTYLIVKEDKIIVGKFYGNEFRYRFDRIMDKVEEIYYNVMNSGVLLWKLENGEIEQLN